MIPAKSPKPKLRKCKNKACGERFIPQRPMQAACCVGCAIVLSKDKIRAEMDAKAKAERAETKRKLDAMKGINELKAEAQKVFNEFIRERDRDQPCICCGKFATAAALSQTGGAYDACHYRSRGSADHLRFDENNVHRGLKDCNTWGHKDYRGGLIARIGVDAVEALEANQTIVKWTKDGLRAIKAEYKAKLKALTMNKGVE